MCIRDRAFNYLYDHYSAALYTVVLQVVKINEQADDTLQEAFVNIWRKIDSYDSTKGRLFTWMLNVCRNLAIDTIRSKGFQQAARNQQMPDDAFFDKSGAITELNVDNVGIKKAVEKLKPEHRVLIDLAYFKGYTHEEIAGIENLPLGTVKTRIRSALTQLRTQLS
jgi:RNA polymerase sigma factor (sigma-70 family)